MKKLFLLIMLTAIFMFNAVAQSKYVYKKSIALPGDGGYDYVFADQINQRLYVSHETMVQVIDLNTDKLIGTIKSMGDVHGIAISTLLNRGFITDSKFNCVFAFDTKTLKVIKKIPLTGKGADGIIYDPYSKMIFAFNGDSNDASVVDPQKLMQTGTVKLGGAPEFAVADGKGQIYSNLEDKSSMDVIDSKTLKVTANYLLAPCGGPTGLAIDNADQKLFTVCRENKGMSILDIKSGKVVQTLPIGAGVDAVIYDDENKTVLVSNADGTASIFKQKSAGAYFLSQTLTTQYRAKTMAINTKNHKVYFSAASFKKGGREPLPGTFKVLVYALN